MNAKNVIQFPKSNQKSDSKDKGKKTPLREGLPKPRQDFLDGVVAQLVRRRNDLGWSQRFLDCRMGVADALVGKWECGLRSPTGFNLHCWADSLGGRLAVVFDENSAKALKLNRLALANDNFESLSVKRRLEK